MVRNQPFTCKIYSADPNLLIIEGSGRPRANIFLLVGPLAIANNRVWIKDISVSEFLRK